MPNTASSESVRNARKSSLVRFIIMFVHYRKHSCCKKVTQVLANKKSQCNKESAMLWFCPELFKSVCSESMVGCVRRLEKLYFTADFIACSTYAVYKHKCLCPLFYEDTCKQWGENNPRILRSQSTHRCLLSTSNWVTQVLSKMSLEPCLESFLHFGRLSLTLSQTSTGIFDPESELQILEDQSYS